jgi:site-specific DNA-cytosine methylase
MKKQFNALGVYVFAGGFSLGVSRYFKILAHLENSMFGVETVRANFKFPVYESIDQWPLDDLKGKVNLIHCNPPCAPFSSVGRSITRGRDNWKTDERVQCFRNCFNVFKKIQPNIMVIESVPRTFDLGKSMITGMTNWALRRGYSVTYFFTNAAFHGLPQNRNRFHFIFSNVQLKLPRPDYNIITVSNVFETIRKDRTETTEVNKIWKPLLKHTKPGGKLQKTFNIINEGHFKYNDRDQVKGRPGFIYQRLDPDKPSPTLLGGCHIIHYKENRYITPLEHAMLCGFPRDYKWRVKADREIYIQAGQGVSSVIGEYLSKQFSRALKINKPTSGKIKLIDYRKKENPIIEKLK